MENVIFEGTDDVGAPGEEFQGPGVDRFDPTRIDQGDRDAFSLEKVCCLLCEGKHISQAEKCDVATVLDNLRLSDLEQFWLRVRLCSGACSTRIANGNRTLVIVCHSP